MSYHLQRFVLAVTDTKSPSIPGLVLASENVSNIVDVDWTSQPGFVWVTLLVSGEGITTEDVLNS